MLTVEQQIAHMKSKGIAFKLVSEEEAAAHLRSYIDSELDRREHDPYVGAIIRKYRHDMPMWVFCELMLIGAGLRERFCPVFVFADEA